MSVLTDGSVQQEEGCISAHVRSSSSLHRHIGTRAAERLTDDLLLEILSRVPAKSLCHFKCISNHCLSLIDHPEHRKKLPQTLAGFAQVETRCYVVCNPATKKWVALPDSGQDNFNVVTTRLGFDPDLSSHFRVFELVEEDVFHFDPDLAGVAVYSSETGAWIYKEKGWNTPMRLIDIQLKSVFLNGHLHFQAHGLGLLYWLAVVDTEGETWMNLGVPGGLSDGFIQRSQGHLYHVNFERDEFDAGFQLVVYVLKNYDSKEWILKHRVGTSVFGQADVCPSADIDWVTIHPECSLIFFTMRCEQGMKFMSYNMDRRQVQVISNLEDVKLPYLPYVPLYAELECLRS